LLNRHLARAAYVVGSALILIPLFDAATSILPFRFGEARWRYGSVGLLSNSLLIPMAGALIVFAVANASNHRRALRALGSIAAVSCALCVLAIFTFALDALQARAGLRPEMQTAYVIGSSMAVAKLVIGAIAFGYFALAGLKRTGGETGRPVTRDQVLVAKLPKTD
jgi:hypothetical protein